MEKIENIFRDIHLLMGGNPLLGSVEVTIFLSNQGIENVQKYLYETINANGSIIVGEAPVNLLEEFSIQTIYGKIKFVSNERT